MLQVVCYGLLGGRGLLDGDGEGVWVGAGHGVGGGLLQAGSGLGGAHSVGAGLAGGFVCIDFGDY